MTMKDHLVVAGVPKVIAFTGVLLAIAVVPVALLAPVYSDGETIADNSGALLFFALAAGTVVASIPLSVPESMRRGAFWCCGAALVLSSFITVLGMFLVPSGLVLMLCGYLAGRQARA